MSKPQFDYLEYGKAFSGSLEFTELGFTALTRGQSRYLLTLLDEPRHEAQDSPALWNVSLWEQGVRYSVALIPQVRENRHLFVEVQRRNEGERSDVRQGRFYNQTRFTLLPNATLLEQFGQGKALYTELIWNAIQRSEDKTQPRLENYQDTRGSELGISPNASSATELRLPTTTAAAYILGWRGSSSSLQSNIKQEHFKLLRHAVLSSLNQIRLGRRVIFVHSDLTLYDRLIVCEALQLLVNGVETNRSERRIISFALDFITRQPVDVMFVTQHDRIGQLNQSQNLVTIPLNNELPITNGVAELNDLLERFSILYHERSTASSWQGYLQQLQELITELMDGVSREQLEMRLKLGEFSLVELATYVNENFEQLATDFVYQVITDPSSWLIKNEKHAKSTHELSGKFLWTSLQLPPNRNYKRFVDQYFAQQVTLKDAMGWHQSRVFVGTAGIDALVELAMKLAPPTVATLDEWASQSDYHAIIESLITENIAFSNGTSLLQLLLETWQEKDFPYLFERVYTVLTTNSQFRNDLEAQSLQERRLLSLSFLVKHGLADLGNFDRLSIYRKIYLESLNIVSPDDIVAYIRVANEFIASLSKKKFNIERVQTYLLQPSSTTYQRLLNEAFNYSDLFDTLVFDELPSALLYESKREGIRAAFYDLLKRVNKASNVSPELQFLVGLFISDPEDLWTFCEHRFVFESTTFFIWSANWWTEAAIPLSRTSLNYLIKLEKDAHHQIQGENIPAILDKVSIHIERYIEDPDLLYNAADIVPDRQKFLNACYSIRQLQESEFWKHLNEISNNHSSSDFNFLREEQNKISKAVVPIPSSIVLDYSAALCVLENHRKKLRTFGIEVKRLILFILEANLHVKGISLHTLDFLWLVNNGNIELVERFAQRNLVLLDTSVVKASDIIDAIIEVYFYSEGKFRKSSELLLKKYFELCTHDSSANEALKIKLKLLDQVRCISLLQSIYYEQYDQKIFVPAERLDHFRWALDLRDAAQDLVVEIYKSFSAEVWQDQSDETWRKLTEQQAQHVILLSIRYTLGLLLSEGEKELDQQKFKLKSFINKYPDTAAKIRERLQSDYRHIAHQNLLNKYIQIIDSILSAPHNSLDVSPVMQSDMLHYSPLTSDLDKRDVTSHTPVRESHLETNETTKDIESEASLLTKVVFNPVMLFIIAIISIFLLVYNTIK